MLLHIISYGETWSFWDYNYFINHNNSKDNGAFFPFSICWLNYIVSLQWKTFQEVEMLSGCTLNIYTKKRIIHSTQTYIKSAKLLAPPTPSYCCSSDCSLVYISSIVLLKTYAAAFSIWDSSNKHNDLRNCVHNCKQYGILVNHTF